MMISPESYYEMYLKGKTPEQIMTRIRCLKKEIGHCKKELESPLSNEMVISPGLDVVLWASRLYLERAKAALKEAGGQYVPSRKEEAALAFKADLQHMEKFVFSIGGFFTGQTTYTLYPHANNVYTVSHSLNLRNDSGEEIPYLAEDFFSMLDEIHLEEWKHRYSDPSVYDGVQWELTITFSNGRRTAAWSGSNAFPPDFEKLEEFFGCFDEE